MSTKIYVAYRIPVNKFDEFIKIAHGKMLSKVAEYIKNDIMPKVMQEGINEKIKNLGVERWNKFDDETKDYFKESIRFDIAVETIMYFSHMSERNGFDVNCGYNCRTYGRYIYIIPYGEYRYTENLRFNKPWIENYAYWNNTDKPNNISQRTWNRRAIQWYKVFKSISYYLPVIDVYAMDAFYYFIPLKEKILKNLKNKNFLGYIGANFYSWHKFITIQYLSRCKEEERKKILDLIKK